MNVTSVELSFPKKPGPKFKCWAKITLDDILLVTGIKLFENCSDEKVERYIRFPDYQLPSRVAGKDHVSIAVVNTKDVEFRQHIIDSVFAKYDMDPRNPANNSNTEESR